MANTKLIRLAILTLCLSAAIVGCSRSESRHGAGAPSSDSTYASPRRSDVESSFLDIQNRRTEQVRAELDSLRQVRPRDVPKIRGLIVKRKGEILSAKKMVRESLNLTDTQKELIVSKLDEESIDLAQELVAVTQ